MRSSRNVPSVRKRPLTVFQSNGETVLVDCLHACRDDVDGFVHVLDRMGAGARTGNDIAMRWSR